MCEEGCGACGSRGGTQYKSGYRDVPQTWVAKSGRQVHQWVPFFSKTWYFDGSIFQNGANLVLWLVNFLKFSEICAKMGQISAKNFDFWYMDGSLFLQNGYMDGWHFKNPSGTPLPRPKLSTPPGCGYVKKSWECIGCEWCSGVWKKIKIQS